MRAQCQGVRYSGLKYRAIPNSVTGSLVQAADPKAAEIKQIRSPVAGRADVLVVPDLESGNMLAKQLEYLAEAQAAGVVLGARVPIIAYKPCRQCKDAIGICGRGSATCAAAPAGVPGDAWSVSPLLIKLREEAICFNQAVVA